MKILTQFFLSACLMLLITASGCQKSTGNSNEENLVVETLPVANGHVEAPAPGPDFPLRVTVKSAIPSGGVKIDVTAKIDGGSVPYFTNSKTTSSGVTDFTIALTPSGVVCLVEITVTSVSTSTNKWSGSYKYSRK